MKFTSIYSVLAIPFFVWGCQSQQSISNKTPEEQAEALLPKLSLDQKVSLVVGMGLPGDEGLIEKVMGAAGNIQDFPDLSLPRVVLADGPAGLRIQPVRDSSDTKRYYATAFPIETSLAASWDTDLVTGVGKAMGHEVKEYGVDVLLAPGMNIHRNPLGARNFEYYSEDPLLSGKMAAAMVNGVESNGVGCSIKHFVANNQETNRTTIDALVSDRALREIYLRGFEIAVREAQPWTVMSAYNKFNGAYASQRYDLLESILRDEWGFNGLVMTDWYAGDDAVVQMEAGNDLLMPGVPAQKERIKEAIISGELSEDTLNKNVKRILTLIYRSPAAQKYAYSDAPDLKASAQIARHAATQGAVLVKNEGALPLASEVKNIAAFGIGSYDFISGGTGSGDVNEAYVVSMVQGLEAAGNPVDQELKVQYEQYIKDEKARLSGLEWYDNSKPIAEKPLTKDQVKAKVKSTDVALITISRNSGEGADRKLEGDFYLTDVEKSMIQTVSEVYRKHGKKVVMVLNIGNVIEMKSWMDQVDAVLITWQGGQEAGHAVADLVLGKVNPSGKLPTTFPVNYDDVPSSKYFPGEEVPGAEPIRMQGVFGFAVPSEVKHIEGIYVGYRYYQTYDVPVAFPFGHGISYTDFSINDLKLSDDTFKKELNFEVKVTNTGTVAGKEVVQVYVAAPGRDLHKPEQELRAFAKTRQLTGGEAQTLSFSLSARDLASFDTDRMAWIVEPGTYELRVGSSSANIVQLATFTVADEIIIEKGLTRLAEGIKIEEWGGPAN
ncbi:Thermostable beta-glucosidase B [Mariniflexile rhizosphaerae]|uniref:glycoside hydrolase family 3 C-terminal domain-containing protein n=1 Tax=unclassified Mariniflexile TaxID=2643887 RepID=UPI000E330CBD|nr:glycoside hydrolase family 3 C-terminal domain-containing protein [Mariniflexile sp. TRM1-10]AXP81650.1 Thermostable beta-glucosidase B [Mariniflexile sp. TRM1-10]